MSGGVKQCEECGTTVTNPATDLDWYGDMDEAMILCKKCGENYPAILERILKEGG